MAQNEHSKVGALCFYRSPKGLKCAIGCLVPDELYDAIMEHFPVNNPKVLEVLWQARVLTDQEFINSIMGVYSQKLSLMQDLQEIHDNYYPSDWAKRLNNLTEEYNL